MPSVKRSIAVYCGSSLGAHDAFYKAALSLGHAIAAGKRALVYGGGSNGIMGVVSNAVSHGGGKVTGIVPYAMVAAGGEGEKVASKVANHVKLNGAPREGDVFAEQIQTIVVDSMHERKVEMARRADGFIGLPGGFGTFEEVLEVTTWTQLGIHNKPVVLANVLGYWEPLRQLIRTGVKQGYIRPDNERVVVFVDGPADYNNHEDYDWGQALLDALDDWDETQAEPLFDWSKSLGQRVTDEAKLTVT
ncbi:hypothetical protein AMATHDRAFT_47712 [Amanita thiersii Skay4041]|uniref:Cytokinin riboside 5'-monophosphate phosphoribohydrolase n=1 Tax=Amanita thiersii Skay4041 TaxID=703135 RepID=A0A2A9NSN9_9AGAR|nr:hypothetical protein AMATHDRAFT_47712 [Amanita thiersii Skay4041]